MSVFLHGGGCRASVLGVGRGWLSMFLVGGGWKVEANKRILYSFILLSFLHHALDEVIRTSLSLLVPPHEANGPLRDVFILTCFFVCIMVIAGCMHA